LTSPVRLPGRACGTPTGLLTVLLAITCCATRRREALFPLSRGLRRASRMFTSPPRRARGCTRDRPRTPARSPADFTLEGSDERPGELDRDGDRAPAHRRATTLDPHLVHLGPLGRARGDVHGPGWPAVLRVGAGHPRGRQTHVGVQHAPSA